MTTVTAIRTLVGLSSPRASKRLVQSPNQEMANDKNPENDTQPAGSSN